MEENAKIVSDILKTLAEMCRIGMTSKELDFTASEMIKSAGATSFNKDYQPSWAKTPYPAFICVSPNGISQHGIPNDYEFKEGDLITIDMGIKRNGLAADGALTVGIGVLSNADARLLYYANKAIWAMLSQVKTGVNTRDLADFIQKWAGQRGYNVNRRGAGHTIGKEMHEKPSIYNTVEDDVHTYADLIEGSVICLEPILTQSKDLIGMLLPDGWSIATFDNKKTAMFEPMVRVTKDGYEMLTDHFADPSN